LGLGLLSRTPVQNFQLHGPLAVELVDLRREGEIEKLRSHTAGTNFAGERGVALAAIQGLNQKMDSENAKLREELKRRDAENAELKQRLEALEKIIHHQKSN
jgi:predicted nuclease with TOPRIM domain